MQKPKPKLINLNQNLPSPKILLSLSLQKQSLIMINQKLRLRKMFLQLNPQLNQLKVEERLDSLVLLLTKLQPKKQKNKLKHPQKSCHPRI